MARTSSTVGSNKSKVGAKKSERPAAPSTSASKGSYTARATGAIRNASKGGIGKAHIAEAGGGRAALLRWRALPKAVRKAAIANNTVAQAAGVGARRRTGSASTTTRGK